MPSCPGKAYKEEGLKLSPGELVVLEVRKKKRKRLKKISQWRGYRKEETEMFQGEESTEFNTAEKSNELRAGGAWKHGDH